MESGRTGRITGEPLRSHRSALSILPPRSIWEPIQELRREYDRKIDHWMPHVNLLYPFRPEARAAEVEPLLRRFGQGCTAFELELAEARVFDHGREFHTIWIAPEPRAEIDALNEGVRALFPDCEDVARHAHGFTPHLALGQARGSAELERVLADVRARWRPLSWTVDRLTWALRGPGGPFEIRSEFRFG